MDGRYYLHTPPEIKISLATNTMLRCTQRPGAETLLRQQVVLYKNEKPPQDLTFRAASPFGTLRHPLTKLSFYAVTSTGYRIEFEV